VRKTEMTTIGQNSPATPVPSTAVPSGVRRSPESARIGTSVPSAVVASATPTSQPLAFRPSATRRYPAAIPIASEMPHPTVQRAIERRGTCSSTTSTPAKKKSIARPRSERNSTYWSALTQPSA
jgi:hypothetical protein